MVLAGAPSYGAPIKEVLAYHAEHRGSVAIAVGLQALYLPRLLAFLTGLHGLVGRRGGAGGVWSRPRGTPGADFLAVFAVYAVLWDGVVLSAGNLAAELGVRARPAHACSSVALALPALGTTFIGAALATHATRLTPRWQLLLGVAGGGLLLAAGAANLAIADGSTLLLFVGVPGYFAWMAWLLATGVRLVRARTADRPDNA